MKAWKAGVQLVFGKRLGWNWARYSQAGRLAGWQLDVDVNMREEKKEKIKKKDGRKKLCHIVHGKMDTPTLPEPVEPGAMTLAGCRRVETAAIKIASKA